MLSRSILFLSLALLADGFAPRSNAFLGQRVVVPTTTTRAVSSSTTLCMKYTLTLVRHGESTWNQENRFTGWVDCPLSVKGEEEARKGGALLREGGFTFDKAYTSTLKRAIKTLWIVLEEVDQMYIPIVNTWRLNER